MIVQVAVAVIINQADDIFISRRSEEQHQGNKWEFPGGKIEENESVEDALFREIKEELGIEITQSEKILNITHEYNPKTVILEVYEVKSWLGEPSGMEGQPTRWVRRDELLELDFPEANKEIIELLVKTA